MPAIDVLYLADDQELVQPLIEALRRYGLDIHERHPGERATDSQLLVVLLTERLVASFTNPAKQLPLEITGYSEVVPVSYFPSEAPVLQDLNHNLIRQVGTDESARRIAAIARFGGRRIVQWNALVDRAQAWKSSADEQKLLDSNELTQALLLLQAKSVIENRNHNFTRTRPASTFHGPGNLPGMFNLVLVFNRRNQMLSHSGR